MRKAVIAGIGSTAFGRHQERAIQSLAVEAGRAALAESGVERGQIGALYLGNFTAGSLCGQEVLAGITADELGLGPIPATKVEGACASGGIAFRHAVMAVRAGLCDAAIALGVEKMAHAPSADVTAALNCAMDNRSDGPSGLTFPGFYGLAWRKYAATGRASRDDVSAVVIKNKAAGLKNPLAQMGADLDAEAIAASAFIADPIQLYDCCPVSDGAAAVVVTTPELAGAAAAQPLDVLAAVQTSGVPRIAGHMDMCSLGATVAASAQALDEAGLGVDDLSLAELHDCFSIAEILNSEDLGLVPRGEGAAWAAEGRTGSDGDRPINPSGGLLAKGHPVGATGLGQLYEAAMQLRGTHSNQVRDARFALTHNLGGAGVACTVSILGRPDA